MVSDGIIFGLGLGIWIGYLVPRTSEIVSLFRQGSTIMAIPPINLIVVYYVGLIDMTIAIAAIHNIWWSIFFFANGTIIPIAFTYIDSNVFGDNKS